MRKFNCVDFLTLPLDKGKYTEWWEGVKLVYPIVEEVKKHLET
jgi:hypothetical protein